MRRRASVVGTTGVLLAVLLLLFETARSLPLRLRRAVIDVVEVDGFDSTIESAADEGSLVESAVGTRFVLEFNQPLLRAPNNPHNDKKDEALADLLRLHCADAGPLPALPNASTPPDPSGAAAFVMSDRQFDAGYFGHGAGCKPVPGSSSSANATARAWRRAFHVLDAFGDVRRSSAPHELRLYAVNLRALPLPAPPTPPLRLRDAPSQDDLDGNGDNMTAAATLLHVRALVAAREELQCRLLLQVGLVNALRGHGRGHGHAAPADGAFDVTSIGRTEISGPDPRGPRQAVSFLVGPPLPPPPAPPRPRQNDTAANESGDDGSEGIPTVELPYGACVFLEESGTAGSGHTHSAFAASAAAAAVAAEERLQKVDAQRAEAMQGLLQKIEGERAERARLQLQQQASGTDGGASGAATATAAVTAAATAAAAKLARKKSEAELAARGAAAMTPEVAKDAAETVPRLIQVRGLAASIATCKTCAPHDA